MDEIKMQGVLEKGYGIMPKMVAKDRELSIEAKAIYAYLTSYCGGGSTAYPPLEMILDDLKISKDRYYKHRKLLIDRGYIEVNQESENKLFSKNIFTIKSSIPCFKDTENKESIKPLKSPFPCFTESEKPYPYFKESENKETNNNNINNNNFNNNNLNNNNIGAVRKLLKVSVKEAEKILAAANNDLDVVVEKWKVIQECNLKNKVGALITAIKEDWNNTPHNSRCKGNFNNYEQRTYDFEVLERKLLGWEE